VTGIEIEDRGPPPTRFGKSLDLPLSFRSFDLFAWPVAVYLILKKDAESSLFQVPFDALGKGVETPILIDS
jgi:hypothetical protein